MGGTSVRQNCKWIDENRVRVIEGMSDEEMNDMGAAIENSISIN